MPAGVAGDGVALSSAAETHGGISRTGRSGLYNETRERAIRIDKSYLDDADAEFFGATDLRKNRTVQQINEQPDLAAKSGNDDKSSDLPSAVGKDEDTSAVMDGLSVFHQANDGQENEAALGPAGATNA